MHVCACVLGDKSLMWMMDSPDVSMMSRRRPPRSNWKVGPILHTPAVALTFRDQGLMFTEVVTDWGPTNSRNQKNVGLWCFSFFFFFRLTFVLNVKKKKNTRSSFICCFLKGTQIMALFHSGLYGATCWWIKSLNLQSQTDCNLCSQRKHQLTPMSRRLFMKSPLRSVFT